jgi:hypothetical protein
MSGVGSTISSSSSSSRFLALAPCFLHSKPT